jgi:hypothetical protein
MIGKALVQKNMNCVLNLNINMLESFVVDQFHTSNFQVLRQIQSIWLRIVFLKYYVHIIWKILSLRT